MVMGETMRPHRKLVLWQEAMELVTKVYEATRAFPPAERFGLADQMRRAAVSVPSNIAEGAARKSGREFTHFLYTARGSLSELDTQLEIASRLGFVKSDMVTEIQACLDKTSRLLSGLIVSKRESSD